MMRQATQPGQERASGAGQLARLELGAAGARRVGLGAELLPPAPAVVRPVEVRRTDGRRAATLSAAAAAFTGAMRPIAACLAW